ncbi:hypothetical protein KY315_01395, partial [Candidatus Woesearchaeota archaeon]|nr:hypothetical protein [Candidatus Woesearchaeota archaeon]
MEKLKDLHRALEKLQRDASKKHYPESELDKKKENPAHILQRHYYATTAAERAFMKEFVEAIEKPTWIADEGKYANLVDAVAVEIPGILKQALPVIHTPEARKFVADAKAEIVPFIREHKTFLENHDLDAKAAIKAAEKIPVGQALYERAMSASHGEIRRLKMQNRALLAGEERLETRLDRLDTKVDKLNQDKKDLKKNVDLSVDYALEKQDEVEGLQTDLDQTRTHLEAELDSMKDLPERLSQYEDENAQLTSEKERLVKEVEAAKSNQSSSILSSLFDDGEDISNGDIVQTEKTVPEDDSEYSSVDMPPEIKNIVDSDSANQSELNDAYAQIEILQSEVISLQERIVYSERDQDEEVRTLQERTTFAEQDLG